MTTERKLFPLERAVLDADIKDIKKCLDKDRIIKVIKFKRDIDFYNNQQANILTYEILMKNIKEMYDL